MKHRILFSMLLAIPLWTMAQISGTSVFLQGQYVEVGINDCGVYGTGEPTPIGPYGEYHTPNPNGLGYIADHEKDGWDVSTDPDQPDFCGDYFTPGSPEEGWALQYGDSVYENHYTDCMGYGYGGWGPDSVGNIPGSNVLYTDTLGVKTAVWEGNLTEDSLDLFVKQITTLQDTALYFISTIEITNNGTSDLTDLYYIRNVDPDQDLDHCGTFMTHNTIESNTPASDTVLVTAIGGACGCYFGTIAVDPRARVSYGAFFLAPYKPSDAYNGLEEYSIEGDLLCDCAVQITYKFDLAVGETTTLSYARLFDGEVVETAINTLETMFEPVISADGAVVSAADGILLCEGQSTALNVNGPLGYTWTWEPSDFLDIASGTDVVSTPTENIVYSVTGTNGTETVSSEVSITVSQTMELSMGSTPSLDGSATGTANVEIVEGGIAPFTYEWMSGQTTASIEGLAPGAYIVWVTDAAGCTATQAVTIGTANSIGQLDAENVFQIYPNPVNGIFHVELAGGLEGVSFEVVSLSGAIVYSTAHLITSPVDIDASNWESGIYLIKVYTSVGCFGQTILVQ